jgi:hypothetical protein
MSTTMHTSTTLKKVFAIAFYGVLGAATMLFVAFILLVNNKPDQAPLCPIFQGLACC